ncbi:MAG: DUF2304 domain-containing protein [Patescibacteria group bacterium]|nr:DUF2304 domain-containing protein [Patescibacteria group bacterium]MDD5164072.1 DUF2304 domain-containing protein [Patescibacteria group bacterium]MDD5534844.1 DUF2304 domain-containing protein [Patescibacteria group bacterium]
MLWIQILFIFLILFIISRLILRLKNNQINFLNFLAWLIFWLAATIAVIWPEVTSFLARILGVGRGADIIVYFSLILLFYFVFYVTVKLKLIERDITKIVGKISLNDKEDKN